MQRTFDDPMAKAWNILDQVISENELLKEENQKLIKKIENLKRKQSSDPDNQQNTSR